MVAIFSIFKTHLNYKLYTNASIVSTGEIFERGRNFFIHKFMLSNVLDLARSTRTAYDSKHFPLRRKKFALYALKIYITQDRMKNL